MFGRSASVLRPVERLEELRRQRAAWVQTELTADGGVAIERVHLTTGAQQAGTATPEVALDLK